MTLMSLSWPVGPTVNWIKASPVLMPARCASRGYAASPITVAWFEQTTAADTGAIAFAIGAGLAGGGATAGGASTGGGSGAITTGAGGGVCVTAMIVVLTRGRADLWNFGGGTNCGAGGLEFRGRHPGVDRRRRGVGVSVSLAFDRLWESL